MEWWFQDGPPSLVNYYTGSSFYLGGTLSVSHNYPALGLNLGPGYLSASTAVITREQTKSEWRKIKRGMLPVLCEKLFTPVLQLDINDNKTFNGQYTVRWLIKSPHPTACEHIAPIRRIFAGIAHWLHNQSTSGEILTCFKKKEHFSSSNIDRVRAIWKQRKSLKVLNWKSLKRLTQGKNSNIWGFIWSIFSPALLDMGT